MADKTLVRKSGVKSGLSLSSSNLISRVRDRPLSYFRSLFGHLSLFFSEREKIVKSSEPALLKTKTSKAGIAF